MRRIVTGHNQDGKSVIKIDGPPSRSIGEDQHWRFIMRFGIQIKSAIQSTDQIDRADIDIILSPLKGGTKFRYFKINPTPEGVSN